MINKIFLLLLISFLNSNELIEPVDFYKDGKIKKTEHFNLIKQKKDLVKIIYYYKNGKIKSEQNYTNLKKDGPFISYYDNQQKYKVGKYEHGFKNGKWTEYDEKGWLKKVIIFKNGRVIKKIDYSRENSFTSQ